MAQEHKDIDFSPPKAVQSAYKRGLALKDEFGGKGLREPTLAKARHFAKGGDNDPAHARKMRAWFARHDTDMKPGWDKPPTPGFVARLLWGGDAGKRWATKLMQQVEQAEADAKAARKADGRQNSAATKKTSASKKTAKKTAGKKKASKKTAGKSAAAKKAPKKSAPRKRASPG